MNPIKIVMFILTFSFFSRADKPGQINKFFSVFSPNCSISGPQTRDAKNTVDSLVETIKSVESDPNCKGLSGVVNELSLISKNVQYLDQPVNSDEKILMSLENRKRELFLVLSQSLSESESQLIQSEIQTVQLSIAEYRGYQQGDFENENFNRRMLATQALVSATNSLFSRISSNESCWISHPSLLENISGIGLAVGQSLSLGARNPETALFLGAGLSLVSNIVDYFHRKKLDAKLDSYVTGIEATALTCALETLSNQYCGAKDSENAIQIVAQALTTKASQDPVWSSIRLLEREVPNITEWLEMVMAGSSPTSASNARQRQEIYIKEEKLKSTLDFVQGLLAEKTKFIDSISDPQKRWIEIRAIVSEISGKIYPSGYNPDPVSNPLEKRFSKDNGSYFLLGFIDPPTMSYQSGASNVSSPIKFESFEPFGKDHAQFRSQVISVTVQTLHTNFRQWYKDTYEVLMAEKSRVLIDDPLMVFAKAYPKSLTGTQKGLSPRHSFIKILEFLRSHQQTKFSAPSLQIILQDTIVRLEGIIKKIDSVMINKEDPEVALNLISSSAKLDKGVGFLRARIEFFIKTIIEEMILESANQDPKKLQLLAASDVIQYLKQFSGSQSLQKMMDDSKNAQSLTSATMLQFLDTFKEPLGNAINYYDGLIRQFNENSSGAHTRSKTILCLNLATMPQTSSMVSFSSCLGLQMNSVFPGGPSSIYLKSETMSMPFESRVCHYRDFHRRNSVFYSLLEDGNVLEVNKATQLNPTPVNLPTYETPVVADSCQSAEAWKTQSNSYCEKDWWDGCDRRYATKCEFIKKRAGLSRFFGF